MEALYNDTIPSRELDELFKVLEKPDLTYFLDVYLQIWAKKQNHLFQWEGVPAILTIKRIADCTGTGYYVADCTVNEKARCFLFICNMKTLNKGSWAIEEIATFNGSLDVMLSQLKKEEV